MGFPKRKKQFYTMMLYDAPAASPTLLRLSTNHSSAPTPTHWGLGLPTCLCAHPLGAGAANMSPLSLLLLPVVLKCLQHRSVVRMPAGVNTGNSRRAQELRIRLRWDEVGERVKLEQILGARCRYGIDRGLRVMQGGPTGQSVSDCGVRGREE